MSAIIIRWYEVVKLHSVFTSSSSSSTSSSSCSSSLPLSLPHSHAHTHTTLMSSCFLKWIGCLVYYIVLDLRPNVRFMCALLCVCEYVWLVAGVCVFVSASTNMQKESWYSFKRCRHNVAHKKSSILIEYANDILCKHFVCVCMP